MKRTIALLIITALLLCGCASDSAGTGEDWVLPTIEPAPTAAATPSPSGVENGLQPEQYIWNEAAAFNMSDPGVDAAGLPQTVSHSGSFDLFGGQFLPDSVFYESYALYDKLSLQKSEHQVLTYDNGELAENAYVEYIYMPSSRNESKSLTVMAELCGYDEVLQIYAQSLYPHVTYPDGLRPDNSVYYLSYFVLERVGEVRYAQWLVLPSAYFTYAENQRSQAEDAGTTADIQRQVLLNFTCGADMSDEEFIAAIRSIYQYAANNRSVPTAVTPTLAPGDKGYA